MSGKKQNELEPLDPPTPRQREVEELIEEEQQLRREAALREVEDRGKPDASGFGAELSGGDADVKPEDVALVGEEFPGGPMPSPDQDIVDEVGRAAGVEYEDTEVLDPERKIERRDDHRWELDPASSEDYRERNTRDPD